MTKHENCLLALSDQRHFNENRGFEREIRMGGTRYRIKSIFNGYTTLDTAVKNIVVKKMQRAIV